MCVGIAPEWRRIRKLAADLIISRLFSSELLIRRMAFTPANNLRSTTNAMGKARDASLE